MPLVKNGAKYGALVKLYLQNYEFVCTAHAGVQFWLLETHRERDESTRKTNTRPLTLSH